VSCVALGVQRLLAVARELLRLLVQARVLDGDGEVRRERRKQRFLVLADGTALLGIDGEQPDHLLPRDQRERDSGLDPGLRSRAAHAREQRFARNVGNGDDAAPAERPEQ